MAIKKISLVDKSKESPKDALILTYDQDSNGRLKLRGVPPRGITQSMVETIGSDVYIGLKGGTVGQYSWNE
jgi:hypothetical protein